MTDEETNVCMSVRSCISKTTSFMGNYYPHGEGI